MPARCRWQTTRRVEWTIEFADCDAPQAVVAATIRGSHLAAGVAHVAPPVTSTARHAVFVATV